MPRFDINEPTDEEEVVADSHGPDAAAVRISGGLQSDNPTMSAACSRERALRALRSRAFCRVADGCFLVRLFGDKASESKNSNNSENYGDSAHRWRRKLASC